MSAELANLDFDIMTLNSYVSTVDHGPSNVYYDTSVTMSYNVYLGPLHTMEIRNSLVLDGATYYIHFSRSNQPLFFIDAGKTVTLQNVVLKDFLPEQVSFGDAQSKLVFGQGTTIELGGPISLSQPWTFIGNSKVQGNAITLGNGGLLDVAGGVLSLDNIVLQNLGANQLRCRTNDGVIQLRDSELVLASNYNFSYGALEFTHDVKLCGTNTFVYSSVMGSTIDAASRLLLDTGITFSYDPVTANRDLLYMTDTSAVLHLNGCTLYSTVTGLRLSRGRVLFDNFVTLSADGTVAAQALSFGKVEDLAGVNDVIVEVLSGADVEQYGYVDIK
jgi:hypothetical protein